MSGMVAEKQGTVRDLWSDRLELVGPSCQNGKKNSPGWTVAEKGGRNQTEIRCMCIAGVLENGKSIKWIEEMKRIS